ncbi:hypothetical protein WR25_00773 isoform H [Diploscapter pachys]|uniref:Uncharacterized protein n=1 Tax=Diploscapter pachys TaxID=2018661 RepID=A0A2A2KI85_9BILA|nr:hypothetical protein WR25_00773 isoform D [Diploscapter pachys]PAV73569.1 hypothetical protein WR25_00773 isoform H [Diploscapter pachys]
MVLWEGNHKSFRMILKVLEIVQLIYLLMCLWYLGQFTSPFLLLTMIYPSWFSIICNLTGFILTGSYLKCTNTIAKSMKKQRSLLVKYGFLAAHWNVMTIGSAMLIYLCRKNPDAFSRNVSKPHECPSYNALISLVLFTFAVDFVTYKILVAFLAYHNVLVANPQTTTTDDPEPLLSQS